MSFLNVFFFKLSLNINYMHLSQNNNFVRYCVLYLKSVHFISGDDIADI